MLSEMPLYGLYSGPSRYISGGYLEYVCSAREIDVSSSNSGRVRYVHFRTNTLGKYMNLCSTPYHPGMG